MRTYDVEHHTSIPDTQNKHKADKNHHSDDELVNELIKKLTTDELGTEMINVMKCSEITK